MEWFLCACAGAAAGFLSGLLGMGGGAIVTPALLVYLPYAGVSGPDAVKIAIASSLATIMPTALSSAQAHAAKGAVDFGVLARLAPGVMLGALAGAAIAVEVNSQIVALLFIAFAVNAALRMILGRRPTPQALAEPPSALALSVRGLGVGALSAILGIGGASMATPMLARHMPMARAVGVSAALGLPLAFAGVVGYMLAETPTGCPQGCVGFVFLPAVGAVGVASVLTAPWGARAAHALPVQALRRTFGCALLITAAGFALKTFPDIGVTQARRLIASVLDRSPSDDGPVAASAPTWLAHAAQVRKGDREPPDRICRQRAFRCESQ